MSVVDRKRMLDAFKLERKDVLINFAWGYQLSVWAPSPVIKSFYVNELDTEVQVPVSYKNVEILKEISQYATRTQGLDFMNHPEAGSTLHVNPQKIKTVSSASFLQNAAPNIVGLVTQSLVGFKSTSSNQMLDIHFSKLVLVEKGQTIKFHNESENKAETFAIIVLTIPVEGGYKGGRINVIHKGKSQSFQFERDNHRLFSLVAFRADCDHNLEPISDGWMVAMVFHLIWKDVAKAADSPLDFPVFLKTFDVIKEEMACWRPSLSLPVKKESLSVPESIPMKIEITPEVESLSLPVSDDKMDVDVSESLPDDSDDAIEDVKHIIPSDPEAELLLFFPLNDKYEELSFANLTGRDRMIAKLFRSLNFLDVHLAFFTQFIDSNMDPLVDWKQDLSNRSFQIKEWFNSSTSLPLSKQIVLDAPSQLLGKINHIHTIVSNVSTGEEDKVLYYHAALVIQPKTQTILHACRYQLDSVLDYLELHSSPIHNPRPSSSKQPTSILNQVVSYFRENPLQAWKCPKINQRSKRLLELCILLKAKQEGLALLEAMGNAVILDLPTSGNGIPNMFLEGICDNLVAKAVADFVTQITDWNTCSGLVMQFITALSIFRQLAHFSSLARDLFENRCIEGAVIIADRISSIVSKLSVPHTKILKDYHILYFMNAIFVLETDPQITSPTRTEAALALFIRLEFDRQCRLIIELQTNLDRLLQDYQSCRKPFLQLCEIIASGDFHSASYISELVLPLVKCFVHFGDSDILQMLVDKICIIPECDISYNHLLDSIMLSSDLFDLADLSNLGKIAVASLIGAGIEQMFDKRHQLKIGVDVEMKPEVNSSDVSLYDATFIGFLISYLDLVLLMERIPDLADSQRVALLGWTCARLPLDPLIDLILETPKKVGSVLKEDHITYGLFCGLCLLVDLFDKNTMSTVACNKTLELVKLFAWLKDEEILQSLLKQLCVGDQNYNQDKEDKKILMEIISSAPDLLDQLIPEYFIFATITTDALFECWVTKMCNLLSSIDSDVADQLDEEISSCVVLYLRNEMEFPHRFQHNIALFASLLQNMSALRLSRLLVNIYQVTPELKTSFKKFVTPSHFWRHIGKTFANKELNNILRSANDAITSLMVDVMICLLWLGDDMSLVPFTKKICYSFENWQENPVVSKIMLSAQARAMAETSHHSQAAFCLLAEQRILRLKMIKARELELCKSIIEPGAKRASACEVQDVELRAFLRNKRTIGF